MYIRCICDLDGKVNGKKCQRCDGWGVTLEAAPQPPLPGQYELALGSDGQQDNSTGNQ